MEAEATFSVIIDEFAGSPGVSVPGEPGRHAFGSSALKVNGSIFAMLAGGRLVLKLPRRRVESLITSGTGTSYDAGKGRPMKEWLTVVTDDAETWLALAREAHEFVGSAHRK